MDSLEGFILTGGQSRRMGADKSRLMLDGESFVERIARELAATTSSVTIVGGNSDLRVPTPKPRAGEPELETRSSKLEALKSVPDVYSAWGALGGVHAALSACSAAWALIVACDFPFVTRELFARLASLADDFDAVAPIQSDGIPQPLVALYRVEPCLSRAEQHIKSGERKPIALLQSVHTRWVSFDELRSLKGADHFFDNINTPADYARASAKGVGADDVAMS
jgi:molybdopterin-guanine dinucleotide biosynthesis protein A